MNKFIKNKIKQHAQSVKDQEVCGLVCVDILTGKTTVVPTENRAQDKRNRFIIEPLDFYEAEKKYGHIVTIYHSHIKRKGNEKIGFSFKDIEICDEVQIPFLLLTLPDEKWNYYEPNKYERIKLLRRPYVRGLWDCYLDARDWYAIHDVYLKYYFPPEDNRFTNYPDFELKLETEGFYKIPLKEAKYGDALLFKYGKTEYVNHCAVKVGGAKIFHHPTKGVSSVNDIDGDLMKHFAFAARHKEFRYDQGEIIW